jgi:tetratricopeptide (TPR) repeat protein
MNHEAEAIHDLNRAIEIDPKTHKAYPLRALYKALHQDRQGAESDLALGISIDASDPLIPRIQSKIQEIRVQGSVPSPQPLVPSSQNVSDQQILDMINSAMIKARQGDTQGAIADLNYTIKIRPNPISYFNLAQIMVASGNRASAIDNYDKGIAIMDRPDARPYFDRALLKCQGGDLAGGIRDFDKALSIDPNYQQAAMLRNEARAQLH